MGTPRGKRRWGVRVVSAAVSLLVMFAYSTLKQPQTGAASDAHEPYHSPQAELEGDLMDVRQMNPAVDLHEIQNSDPINGYWTSDGAGRHLLTINPDHRRDGFLGDDDDDTDNCTKPRHAHAGFNDSCDFVRQQCQGEMQLINYLTFITCDLKHVQPLGFILLALWLLYLISLLATTADNFFVPPLNLLSEKLKLSPSIAGITLLAIGNGAPDVFTAYAALKEHNGGKEMALVLGALIGASIFISTIVLGTIIIISQVTSENIDKLDFIRDVVAYMSVVALVVGVGFDGTVHLIEAIAFPLFYFAYIAIVVAISYLRRWYANVKKRRLQDSETTPFLHPEINTADKKHVKSKEAIADSMRVGDRVREEGRLELLGLTWVSVPLALGLTWPRNKNIVVKLQWLIEWPFSLLRWLSIPPCYYDGQWTVWHHWFAVTSPVPMAVVLLVAAKGWHGFSLHLGKLPLIVFIFIIGIMLSVMLFFLLSTEKPPHWSMQFLLGVAAFVMSIAWLNIEANEVVSVLEAFGLLLNVDTAILGLTVLAIGNSVGDLVADTAVARAGKPGMGVASCFGSPLLNDVMGLSVALIVRIGVYDHGKTYVFPIHSPEFDKVKLSWIFLGISLASSAVIFPLFKFSPPKVYGVALIYIYVVFMVFSVLDATGVLPIHFH